jgi:hypothetical protein
MQGACQRDAWSLYAGHVGNISIKFMRLAAIRPLSRAGDGRVLLSN